MKYRNLLTLFLFFLLPNITFCQSFNKEFRRVDVYNNAGQNPHDFVFSYDVINGQGTCTINFNVINNFNSANYFKFQIFFDEVMVHSGWAATNALSAVFFNNAFSHCNVAPAGIRIAIIP